MSGYRLHVWDIANGRVIERRDLPGMVVPVDEALTASQRQGVRAVSVCEVDDDGELGVRVGVARYGSWWADEVRRG